MMELTDHEKRENMENAIKRMHGDATPRESLIAELAAGADDTRARAVVDALDAYLAAGVDLPVPLAYCPPSVADLADERDTAVARAEKAERELEDLREQFARSPKKARIKTRKGPRR